MDVASWGGIVTRRARHPVALAAARHAAERMHRALDGTGWPLPALTPRERVGVLLTEAREAERRHKHAEARDRLREAMALLADAGVEMTVTGGTR